MTKNNIYTVDFKNPELEIVKTAAGILSKGGIIVAPTETRYGLLAKADDSKILEKLYKLKKRPNQMPTALFVNSIDKIKELAILNRISEKLANKFLPGSITLILKDKSNLPSPVVIDGKIGIRYSSSPFIMALLNEIDFPITATSANLSGHPECKTITEIYESFKDEVDMYIDIGVLDKELSTVVDLSSDKFSVLREGAISTKEIEDEIGSN